MQGLPGGIEIGGGYGTAHIHILRAHFESKNVTWDLLLLTPASLHDTATSNGGVICTSFKKIQQFYSLKPLVMLSIPQGRNSILSLKLNIREKGNKQYYKRRN